MTTAATDMTTPSASPATPAQPTNAKVSRMHAALAAAKAATAAATETKEAPAPVADATPAAAAIAEAKEVAAEKADPEAPKAEPEKEDPLDVRARIKAKEQRIQERAKQELASAHALQAKANEAIAQAQEINRRFMELQKRDERLAMLRKTDHAAWAQEVGLDDDVHQTLIAKKLADKSPEAKAHLEGQRIAALEAKLAEADKQREQAQQHTQIQQMQQSFLQLAMTDDFPAIKTLYANDTRALIREAYNVQDMFRQEFRRDPTQQEIALNLNAIKLRELERGASLLAKPVATPVAAASDETAKAKIPGPSATGAVGGDKTATVSKKEKWKRAEQASRKARASLPGRK